MLHQDSDAEEENQQTSDLKLSLLSFLQRIIEGLQPEQLQGLRANLNEKQVSIGEFCAGMATGTICAGALSRVLQEVHDLVVHFHSCFYTECVPWKQEVIKRVHETLNSNCPINIFTKTADLASKAEPLACDIAVKAIECDDISTLSSTPRGVMDERGKSGSSFVTDWHLMLQFFDFW